jgi:membrane protein implicated in regulation of membrane protease activity
VLTLMYIAFAVVGCGYVLISAFLGHLGVEDGGHAGGGEHVHVHHGAGDRYGLDGQGHGSTTAGHGGGGFHFPFFSPLAVSTLLASVGGYGLIALYGLHTGEGASLLIALPAACVTAYGITYAGWRLAMGSRASSVIRMSSMAGSLAEVTVPIPAGGVGEAVAMVDGQRYAAPAREVNGREVPRGTPVRVVEMVGPTLMVSVGSQGTHTPPGGSLTQDNERGSDA